MYGKKIGFWIAVGGVGILSNFALELLADKVPSLGLSRFVAYSHRGPSTEGN